MNISTLIYLVLIFSFQVQASHLCAEETDQTSDCKKCIANSKLDQGTCKCLDGYISDNKVNKCYCTQINYNQLACLPNCKRCKPFQLNQCEECFGDNADPQNQCACKKGYIYSSQMETCINKNNDLNLEHLKYQIESKEFESLKFDFCLPVEEYAETSHLYKLKVNNATASLQLNFTELNNQSSIAYIQTKEKVIFEKILLQKIKSRPMLRDFNETIFEINYIQGLSQTKDNNEKQNLILMIEIKNVISNSYYFLLMKCGLQGSLEEQKIQESHVNQVVDKYFNLFYQCPSNCKTCTFQTTEKWSKVQCKQCVSGMKLDNGKCFYENQPIKIREVRLISGSEENTECDIQTYLNKDGYCELCDIQNCEECENQQSCKKCNENFELKDGKCQCKQDKNEQCYNNINKLCAYQNGNECLQCNYGYYLHQNECLKMLSNEQLLCIKQDQCYNCLNMEQVIQKSKFESNKEICECENGYFLNYRLLQCNQCDSSCKTCVDRQIKCTSCKDGFYLQDNKCKKCPSTCLRCDSNDKCINCIDGYYLHQFQCKKCEFLNQDKNVCAKCQNDKICTEAIEGYYVDSSSNRVNKCEIENCKVCKDKQICERCDPNYFVEKGSCVQCHEGCVSCDRNNELNQIKCFNCSPNYTLSDEDGNCKKCPSNCKQCATPNTCNECKEGFKLSLETQLCGCENANEYFKNNKCQICVHNCEVCETKDKCKRCSTSYVANSKGLCEKKQCKIKKCEICQSDDSCDQCEDSIYYPEEKKCTCKGNCETCTLLDSKQQCTKCKSKYYLKQNECVESHCEDEAKDGKCKKCKMGYFINSNGQCEQCEPKNCKECTNNVCDVCQQGFYLLDQVCKKCSDPQCLVCEYDQNEEQDQCKTCMLGYSSKETKCYKENNMFPLLALVFIIAVIYGAFYFKEQILSLCSNQNQGFVNSSDQDVELTNKSKTQTKQNRDDDFNILED